MPKDLNKSKKEVPFEQSPKKELKEATPEPISPAVLPASKQKKILIADDEPVNLKGLELMLRKEGYKVHCVKDGSEVLEILCREKFDCVLMDIRMSFLDGEETTKQIRSSNKCFSAIPIIAQTAFSIKGDRENFLQAGMDDFIPKPVEKEELLKVLDRNLQL